MHGGDIYRNRVELDYSVNINPLGVPLAVQEALEAASQACCHYPDLQSEALKKALSAYTGAAVTQISVGNGASELFLAIMHALRPGCVLLQAPSFTGYATCCAAMGCEVRYVCSKEKDGFALTEAFLDQMTSQIDLIFLANPNNPVGSLIEPGLLWQILQRAKAYGITVVLDECFLEFVPEERKRTMMGQVNEYPNLIVVRAFTKICAIPGVRLGYCVCETKMAKLIQRHLPEWNLSVYAQKAGVAAVNVLQAGAYLQQTRWLIQEEKRKLLCAIQKSGRKGYDSAANFLLFYADTQMAEAFLQQGILIRDCSDFVGLGTGFYRIAIRTREQNQRFMTVLQQLGDRGDENSRICCTGRN